MNISKNAEEKVSELIKETKVTLPNKDIFFRVSVQPGGCSGLRYNFTFDYDRLDGDQSASYDGFELVVDKMSSPYLDKAELDFFDTIEKQGFYVNNLNAEGSCSCGDSFH
jgi:iron-sulfur cluster assembly accessory protein